MNKSAKLIKIVSEESDYFMDDVCTNCYKWSNLENPEGICSCGKKYPLSLVLPYDLTWAYSEELIGQFKKYSGLRIMGKFIGKEPELIKKLNHVEYLYLSRYKGFEFSLLNSFNNLKALTIDLMRVENLSGIQCVPQLESLSLVECQKLSDLHGIEKLKNLKVLSLGICNKITNLEPLNSLSSLKFLVVDSKAIHTLQGIKIKNLEQLCFSHDARIKDKNIEPLYNLRKLNKLRFRKSLFKASDVRNFKEKRLSCIVETY